MNTTTTTSLIPRSSIENLLDKKCAKYQIMSDKYFIPIDCEIIVYCSHNHVFRTILQYGFDCTICSLLGKLHTTDLGITCTQSEYLAGQTAFEFICSKNHKFFVRTDQFTKSCFPCKALDLARARHQPLILRELVLDNRCIYKNKHSRLRFHCDKKYHDPECNNAECIALRGKRGARDYAFGCMNMKICGQDFYASLDDLYSNDIYDCKNNHIRCDRGPIIAVLRCFEILFDERFDDSSAGNTGDIQTMLAVEFTAYNIKLCIACIHMQDKYPAASLDQANIYAKEHNILLIVVPEDYIKSATIVTYIITQLYSCGALHQDSIEHSVQRVRTIMRRQNKEKKLFKDRCCY